MIYLIIVIFVFMMIMLPVVSVLAGKLKLLRTAIEREAAIQIAEAGINYYQWHLSHFPSDYTDGTGQPGPYLHDYIDKDTQNNVGRFSLLIVPPQIGSTITTVTSTGWTNFNPNITRSITARSGVPSFTQYAFLSNDIMWIGEDEEISGKLHSNNGIRFDGIGNAPIASAKLTYTCPSSQGSPCPAVKDGVWGSAPQYVQSFWKFPVPAVDFSSLTSDLAAIKSLAQSGGFYLPPSSEQGYSLVFNADGTFSAYKVTKLQGTPTGWDVNGLAHNEDTDYKNRSLQFTSALPANGVIYVEDKTWVEGTVRGRVTVVAAKLPYDPSSAPTIYIPNNIIYSAKDGADVLGLISQKDVVVTFRAPDVLEINAAIISQNGSAQAFYYPSTIKESITIFGSLMTFGQWTWSWVNPGGQIISGHKNTYHIYDANLLYGPPPSFPLSASGYEILDWVSN